MLAFSFSTIYVHLRHKQLCLQVISVCIWRPNMACLAVYRSPISFLWRRFMCTHWLQCVSLVTECSFWTRDRSQSSTHRLTWSLRKESSMGWLKTRVWCEPLCCKPQCLHTVSHTHNASECNVVLFGFFYIIVVFLWLQCLCFIMKQSIFVLYYLSHFWKLFNREDFCSVTCDSFCKPNL